MLSASHFHDQQRKRVREDEGEPAAGGPVGFTEHRSKRLQSLPLRTSPKSRRWVERPSFPGPNQVQTMTPEEPFPEQQMWDEPELISAKPSSPAMAAGAFDGDMDMMDTTEATSDPTQPGFQAPPSSFHVNQTEPSVTGRIPTPIHCNFAAQVRGKAWNGGNATQHGDVLGTTPEEPNAAAFAHNGLIGISSHRPGAVTADPAAHGLADWATVQNRRLPSPISECGVEDSLESARMALDACSMPGDHHQDHKDPHNHHHLSHLTHEHPLLAGLPPRASSAMEARTLRREGTPASTEGNPGIISNNNYNNTAAMDGDSPQRKGHTRSKHTVNSWTALQPGMKRSFSIGYRADCEKCRMKVPGHFNHIIIS